MVSSDFKPVLRGKTPSPREKSAETTSSAPARTAERGFHDRARIFVDKRFAPPPAITSAPRSSRVRWTLCCFRFLSTNARLAARNVSAAASLRSDRAGEAARGDLHRSPCPIARPAVGIGLEHGVLRSGCATIGSQPASCARRAAG